MEHLYYYIGLTMFWLTAGIGTLLIIGFLCRALFDEIGRRSKTVCLVIDYVRHKKAFKIYLNDVEKKRKHHEND